MIVFICGGVKGGKSMFAQFISKYLHENEPGSKLCYFATMIPTDAEDQKRIQRHIKDRSGWGFETIEEGKSIPKVFSKLDGNEVILFDSVTAIVQNNIFSGEEPDLNFEPEWTANDFLELGKRVKHLVIVSDYVFSDALQYDDLTDFFREKLGEVHRIIAAEADVVMECAFSNIKEWKNAEKLDLSEIKNQYYKVYDHLKYGDI